MEFFDAIANTSHLPFCSFLFLDTISISKPIPLFLPPLASRKFLAKLHFFYEMNPSLKKKYEVIFCSVDKSEDDYKEFISEMPWWCLPYAADTLPKLVTSLQANSMPHLVVIDTDGKIITKDAVSALKQDPTGKHFPWRPKRVVDILPETYISGDQSNDDEYVMVNTKDLDDKYLLLYFASQSCPLCQEFTPWLVKAYAIMCQKREDFEVSTTIRCTNLPYRLTKVVKKLTFVFCF